MMKKYFRIKISHDQPPDFRNPTADELKVGANVLFSTSDGIKTANLSKVTYVGLWMYLLKGTIFQIFGTDEKFESIYIPASGKGIIHIHHS